MIEKQEAQTLFRFLRSRSEVESRFSNERVLQLAWGQLVRPGRTASRLSQKKQHELREAISEIANRLHDLSSQRDLQLFAERAVAATHMALGKGSHPGARIEDRVHDGPALAEAAVWAERSKAMDDEDLVRRAVTRALREKRKARGTDRRLPVADGHPIRDLLDLPSHGAVRVKRSDLRNQMVARNSKDQRLLPKLLEQAAQFSERALRPALGEELWGMCQPVGFSGVHKRTLNIRVRSSAFAQEVQMRKLELLARIKSVPGFDKIRDLRFEITPKTKLPLL